MLHVGFIAKWFGSVGSIPTGWSLCDGTNGTPNLRDKFIVAAGGAYAPDAAGGSSPHSHLYSGPFHTHTLEAGGAINVGTFISKLTDQSKMTGSLNSNPNVPTYHALWRVMFTG